jgi:hypothetical protein
MTTYTYSMHGSRERAERALEDAFASGDIAECEFAGIVKASGFWAILLWEY